MGPEDREPFRHQDLFGGQGEVQVWDLLGRRALPPFEAVLSCELEAGGSVGAHRQATADELVVILAGEGTATVDGAEQRLEPGAVVTLALGALLTLNNSSAEAPLSYLIVKARRAS
jgi:quercetin dioxygenase-like cupin family protein